MGVIYSVRDDVRDLVYPFIIFIIEKGGPQDYSMVWDAYHSASLGHISAADFWKAVGLNPGLEDEYLQRYELNEGLVDFLREANSRGQEIWCLSNDISEWSKTLRRYFELETYFKGFVISGDVGCRKPDEGIYHYLIAQVNTAPRNMVFIDDAIRNLDAARELGFNTILFAPSDRDKSQDNHKVAHGFTDILRVVAQ
jgi:HAD superfamily hydrolase (TIGR01509 family)